MAALPASSEYESIDTRITSGIEYADALIDSKLSACYTVPFKKAPKLIKHISADLAAAFELDGAFSGGGEDEPTALSNTLRKRAMDLLDQIASKQVLLPMSEAAPADSEQIGVVPNHSCLGQSPSLQHFDLYNVPNRRSL